MSDYLWDKSGEPDPEVQRLEELLSPFAMKKAPLRFPERRRWRPLLVVAASVAVITAAVTFWYVRRPHGPAWEVVAIGGNGGARQLTDGGVVETNGSSRARLEMSTFGHVELEPNTKLKLLVTKSDEQRMALSRGKIHALIWAPPGQFVVNTPSAVTVDLGCSYTLEVDLLGDSIVRVSFGWVAFEDHGRESFIPATAMCKTRPNHGPGIPVYEDAPYELQKGVDVFDGNGDLKAAEAILRSARPRDAMTVWHLLRRVPDAQRGEVYDRLSQLIHLPDDVTRDQVVRGDTRAIEEIWNSLGLGDMAWWRMWKR
ncbi:MAG TPA: FecR domain-containing protein [Bryobacteraceae bacterium]|nr:FecR domain-containing protein [Bryobacteraceae bacterium]